MDPFIAYLLIKRIEEDNKNFQKKRKKTKKTKDNQTTEKNNLKYCEFCGQYRYWCLCHV